MAWLMEELWRVPRERSRAVEYVCKQTKVNNSSNSMDSMSGFGFLGFMKDFVDSLDFAYRVNYLHTHTCRIEKVADTHTALLPLLHTHTKKLR